MRKIPTSVLGLLACGMYLAAAQGAHAADAYINVDVENLRDEADGRKIGKLLRGTRVEAVERQGNWARVRVDGWVWAPSLDERKPTRKLPTVGFLLKSWTWKNLPEQNAILVEGVTANRSADRHSSVRIHFSVSDGNGRLLGTGTAPTTPGTIAAGGEASFTAMVQGAQNETASLLIEYRFESGAEVSPRPQ